MLKKTLKIITLSVGFVLTAGFVNVEGEQTNNLNQTILDYEDISHLSSKDYMSSYPNSYKMIENGLKNLDNEVYFDPHEINYEDIKHLIVEVMKNHHSSYNVELWTTYNNGEIILKYRLKDDSKEKTREKNLLVQKKAEQILNSIIKPEFSSRDKIKAIHDYLVLNVKYDKESVKPGAVRNYDSQSAYGALINGIAVCEGYARAAKLMMDQLNIENYYIIGYTEKNELHAWNHVKINGKDLYMDVTWDDNNVSSKDELIYKHFLISNSKLKEIGHSAVSGYPINE